MKQKPEGPYKNITVVAIQHFHHQPLFIDLPLEEKAFWEIFILQEMLTGTFSTLFSGISSCTSGFPKHNVNSFEEKLTQYAFSGTITQFFFWKKQLFQDKRWITFCMTGADKLILLSNTIKLLACPQSTFSSHQWILEKKNNKTMIQCLNYTSSQENKLCIWTSHQFHHNTFPSRTSLYLWNNTSVVKTFGTMYRLILHTN